MYLSATMSFAAGAFLAGIGALAVREVEKKREFFFAAAPLLFGIIQLIEGVIWLSFGNGLLQTYQTWLSSAVVFFAYALWPVYSPMSVWALETNKVRRSFMFFFVAAGYILGFYFLQYLLSSSYSVSLFNNRLYYETNIPDLFYLAIPYLFVVFGAYLFSSSRIIFYLGAGNILICSLVNFFFPLSFLPIWTFFASVLSAFAYLFFLRRQLHRIREANRR